MNKQVIEAHDIQQEQLKTMKGLKLKKRINEIELEMEEEREGFTF